MKVFSYYVFLCFINLTHLPFKERWLLSIICPCLHSFGMVIIICSSASTVLEWLSSYAALRAQFWNFKKRVSNYNAALPAQFWDGFQNLQFFILRLLKAEKIKKKFKVYSILYINSFSGISFRFIIHSWLPTKDNFINLKLF